jgi:hypothetical protein
MAKGSHKPGGTAFSRATWRAASYIGDRFAESQAEGERRWIDFGSDNGSGPRPLMAGMARRVGRWAIRVLRFLSICVWILPALVVFLIFLPWLIKDEEDYFN